MKGPHERIFVAVARQTRLWVLVRLTNKASEQYMGRTRVGRLELDGSGTVRTITYVPKPLNCKAKTAKSSQGRYEQAGLVVDPGLCPAALGTGLNKAKECWHEFKQVLSKPQNGYAVDTNRSSRHYGCVTLRGSYIHADYDLFDVVDPAHPTRNVPVPRETLGQRNMTSAEADRIQAKCNALFGVAMVQHGAEAQYAGFSEQPIEIFGPQGERLTVLTELGLRDFYEKGLAGRRPSDNRPMERFCDRCKAPKKLRTGDQGRPYWELTCRCYDNEPGGTVIPLPGRR